MFLVGLNVERVKLCYSIFQRTLVCCVTAEFSSMDNLSGPNLITKYELFCGKPHGASAASYSAPWSVYQLAMPGLHIVRAVYADHSSLLR